MESTTTLCYTCNESPATIKESRCIERGPQSQSEIGNVRTLTELFGSSAKICWKGNMPYGQHLYCQSCFDKRKRMTFNSYTFMVTFEHGNF